MEAQQVSYTFWNLHLAILEYLLFYHSNSQVKLQFNSLIKLVFDELTFRDISLFCNYSNLSSTHIAGFTGLSVRIYVLDQNCFLVGYSRSFLPGSDWTHFFFLVGGISISMETE